MNRRVRAIIRKEFIHIWRDPRSLGVAILLPIVLLLLYGYGINLDVRHLKTAVLDEDNSNQSRTLLSSFEHSGYFDFVSRPDSYSDIEEQLDYSIAKVAIIVRKDSRTICLTEKPNTGNSRRFRLDYGCACHQLRFSGSSEIQQRCNDTGISRRGMASVAASGLDVRTALV